MRLFDYFRDTKGELKHVSWPTRRQAVSFTIIVILISLSVAVFLGVFDFIFAQLLERLVL